LGIWDAVKKLSAFEKITIILLGSLFAPFCEELFFRGVIFERFLQAGLPIFGLIFSSVIFASIHLDFTNIIVYLLFGLILAFLYWKTKSLAASIVAHGINNALAFIFLIFL
jgi:membrane protease YdiL (CAAX protease family)